MTVNVEQIQEQIRVVQRHAKEAQELHLVAVHSLAEQPESQKLREEAEGLEREIAAHKRQEQRLMLAISEAARRNSAAAKADRVDSLKASRQRVDKLESKMTALAEKVIDQIEGLGPLLAEYDGLASERGALAWDIYGAQRDIGPDFKPPRGWENFREAAHLRTGDVPAAVAAALWRSGVGRTGLNLEPWLTLSAPASYGQYAKGDIRTTMRQNLKKLGERLANGLDRALQAVEAA